MRSTRIGKQRAEHMGCEEEHEEEEQKRTIRRQIETNELRGNNGATKTTESTTETFHNAPSYLQLFTVFLQPCNFEVKG